MSNRRRCSEEGLEVAIASNRDLLSVIHLTEVSSDLFSTSFTSSAR